MAWRIVKQPNGKFARWTDMLSQFTHMNFSETEILNLCLQECDAQDALNKIGMAKADVVDPALSPIRIQPAHDGLDRWREALYLIEVAHGTQIRNTIEQHDVEQLPAALDAGDEEDEQPE